MTLQFSLVADNKSQGFRSEVTKWLETQAAILIKLRNT